MKIALIANDFLQQFPLQNYGGIETCVENLALGLNKKNIDFFVVCPKRLYKKKYDFDVIDTDELPTSITNKNSSYYAYSVAKKLKDMNFDAIWSQSHWSIDPLLLFKKPIICTFHDSCEKQHGWMKNYEKVKYRFISNFQFKNWVKEKWETDKSFMLYTGLYDDEFILNEQKKEYYLWCAGLNWGLNAKGLDVVIKLSEIFKNKNFLIYRAGNKELEQYLIEKDNQLSNFFYKGKLNRGKEHQEVFSNAKAFIMPTRLPEALGRTVIESFSKGTPVFGSRNGSLEELIKDGMNGLKFDLNKLDLDFNLKFNYKNIFEDSKRFDVENEVIGLLEQTINLI